MERKRALNKALAAAVTGAFIGLWLAERRRSLRPSVEARALHDLRNLSVAAIAGITLRLLEKPVTRRLTRSVEVRGLGLVNQLPLRGGARAAVAVVLLDYTLYLWHVVTHRVPVLWKMHRPHHMDLDLTVTTAIRFHFAELSVSVLWRALQIRAIGVSSQALRIWQKLLMISVLFHHSNLRLSPAAERWLAFVVITPRLHGIHHSIREEEMNSNWSSGLILWDRLHGTFRDQSFEPPPEILIGVRGARSPEDVTLGRVLLSPFQASAGIQMPRNCRVDSVLP